MLDGWNFAIALLTGTLTVPALSWPAERTRLIRASDMDRTSDDVELPPEAPQPRAPSQLALEVMHHLSIYPDRSVREAAAALGLPRSTVFRGITELRACGIDVRTEGRSGRTRREVSARL